MGLKGLSLSFLLLCCGVGLYGNEKAELKSNMQINYLQTPNAAENFEELFSKGIFYGRLRANSFLFEWDDDSSASRENHYVAGVGGSLIFKSAHLHGFGFETGLYTTQNPWHMNDSYTPFYKAGKGVLSRYDVLTKDDYGINSLAIAYLQYKNNMIDIKVGRQLFESTFTASNDTKMIPNSFEGLTLQTSFLSNTDIKLAYLTKEKLRDHSNFHHLFAYGDGSGAYSQYTQNDDTAMHQGITMSALKQRGIDDVLYIAEFTNKSLPNSEIKLNITAAPELITLAMIEAKYNFKINDTLTLSPALRYIRQFDEGAGTFAGANLKCDTVDYKSPDSLDGSMFAAKLDLSYGAFKTRLGYSEVADKADLVTPWRGFPTGGYTRAMAQYNWYANTKSSMIRFDYDFDKAGLIDGVSAFTRFVIQDFDDGKSGVQADSKVLTLDVIKKFDSIPRLYAKFRCAFVKGDTDTVASNGKLKSDPSYNEYRLELNYLF